ncbi:transmembrane emp24 domain-containing protein 5-like [Aricia agestis]|uniref:transmembrane emp24 domain-containing protein 5-like n=1 Tax=Aricia agestis TaxID=91739 RepID=UPI001C204A69|nr:transmembrane emp24 domain-containing protein 5-like [Aricia agestis]
MIFLILSTIFSVVFAYQKDMTFTVQAGKTDCFYQNVLVDDIIDMEYQVIDSTHGELDISFQLSDPTGRSIVADYKKQDNAHRHTSTLEGDYKFCFDNTFSTFSEKTVYFDLLIDNDENQDKDYDDDKELEMGGSSADVYMMRVRDISEAVGRMREHVAAARRLQDLLSAHEARDRNLAEEMCSRVMNWSIWQIIMMIVVSIIQVYVLRSLFEDQNSRSYRKLIPNFMPQ